MKLFRHSHIASEWQQKRLVWDVNKEDEKIPDAAQKAPARKMSPDDEESEMQKAATRLKVDEILSESGDNHSSAQIAERIQEMQTLRDAGKTTELSRKIMGWYGTHKDYGTKVKNNATNIPMTLLDEIRTGELKQMEKQLAVEAKLELKDIIKVQKPEKFIDALNHLTGIAGAGRLSTETSALLGEINLGSPNSATQFLYLTHEREQLQNRLDISKAELTQAQGHLDAHNTEKILFQEEKARFSKKFSKILGIVAKVSGVIGGVGAVGTLAAGAPWWGVGIGALGALGLTGAGGVIVKLLQKGNDIRRDVSHWWTEFGHERAIERLEEAPLIRERRLAVMTAEKRLAQYRTENAGKLAVLRRQYDDYQQALIDAPNDAERTRLQGEIDSLLSIMTLYRVSEGDNAKRITARGPVTNEFIVQQLHALGVRGVDDTNNTEADLLRLAQADDQNHVLRHQKTLHDLAYDEALDKELNNLNNTEETRLRAFLAIPNNPVGPLLTADVRRKYPRLVSAVDALHLMPDNNAWRESFRLAMLKEMDGREGEISRASIKGVLSDMQSTNKDTAKQLQRTPNMLIAFATAQNALPRALGVAAPYPLLPQNARGGETLESWITRLERNEVAVVLTLLEAVRNLQINERGELVDRLGPIRTEIETAFNGLDASIQTLLGVDAKSLLTDAVDKIFNQKNKVFDLQVGNGTTFLQAVEQLSDGKELNELRNLLIQMRQKAFIRNNHIELFEDDSKAIYKRLGELKDDKISSLVKNHPECLRVLTTPHSNVPAFTGMNPIVTNFDDYLRRIRPDQRQLIIDLIPTIKNTAEPFVLNETETDLENERDQLRTSITTIFDDFSNGKSQVKEANKVAPILNSEYNTAISLLQSATQIVNGQRKSISLSPTGADFKSKIQNTKKLNELRILKDLMQGIETLCDFKNGVFIRRVLKDPE